MGLLGARVRRRRVLYIGFQAVSVWAPCTQSHTKMLVCSKSYVCHSVCVCICVSICACVFGSKRSSDRAV